MRKHQRLVIVFNHGRKARHLHAEVVGRTSADNQAGDDRGMPPFAVTVIDRHNSHRLRNGKVAGVELQRGRIAGSGCELGGKQHLMLCQVRQPVANPNQQRAGGRFTEHQGVGIGGVAFAHQCGPAALQHRHPASTWSRRGNGHGQRCRRQAIVVSVRTAHTMRERGCVRDLVTIVIYGTNCNCLRSGIVSSGKSQYLWRSAQLRVFPDGHHHIPGWRACEFDGVCVGSAALIHCGTCARLHYC